MELEHLQERYMSCLRSFVEHSAPQQPNRFHDLLVRLPEVSLTNKEISPDGSPRVSFRFSLGSVTYVSAD